MAQRHGLVTHTLSLEAGALPSMRWKPEGSRVGLEADLHAATMCSREGARASQGARQHPKPKPTCYPRNRARIDVGRRRYRRSSRSSGRVFIRCDPAERGCKRTCRGQGTAKNADITILTARVGGWPESVDGRGDKATAKVRLLRGRFAAERLEDFRTSQD